MLTVDFLHQVLSYDKETGKFTWKVSRGNVSAGTAAGVIAEGRISIRVNGKIYRANRLAWFYVTGEWPNGEVDHIDGDSLNDKWTNLRDVSRQVNQQNQRKPLIRNESGLLGVSQNKHTGKFTARVSVNSQIHWLGTYETPGLAHAAYIQGKRDLHEGCTL